MSYPGCLFCRIVAREEPADLLEEWPDAIAIVTLNPVTPGHTLVIPKAHVPDFMSDSLITAMVFGRAAELADELHRPAVNLITSAGADATQTIFHLHVHVVPRKANDGLALPWTAETKAGAQ